MTPLRRVLAPLTAIYLFCQVGTVAFVPVALWIGAAEPHAEECTCGHEVGAMCPMHHKPTSRPGECAVRAANSLGTAVLAALVGVVGLLEPTVSVHSALSPMDHQAADDRFVGERPVPPDPPPPRA